MRRQFLDTPVAPSDVTALVTVGLKGPSAGFSQGIEYLVLTEQAERNALLEAVTTPGWLNTHPTHARLPYAPLILIPLIDKDAYLSRYRAPDKPRSSDPLKWPVPYWYFDAGASVLLVLLKAVDLGLGACYIGVYRGEQSARELLDIPSRLDIAGLVCVGHTDPDEPITGSPATHRRKDSQTQLHWNRYGRHLN